VRKFKELYIKKDKKIMKKIKLAPFMQNKSQRKNKRKTDTIKITIK